MTLEEVIDELNVAKYAYEAHLRSNPSDRETSGRLRVRVLDLMEKKEELEGKKRNKTK